MVIKGKKSEGWEGGKQVIGNNGNKGGSERGRGVGKQGIMVIKGE